MSIAIALALGYFIGASVSKLSLALLACLAAGVLTSAGFVLLPVFLANAPVPPPDLIPRFVIQAFTFSFLSCIGLYFGRRSARKGYGDKS